MLGSSSTRSRQGGEPVSVMAVPRRRGGLGADRQDDTEGGAVSEATVHGDLPVVTLDDAVSQ